MEILELIEYIKQVDNTKSEVISDYTIKVLNSLDDFYALIDSREVVDIQFIVSPFNQKCLQIYYANGGVIITPDDFVFDVQQDELIKVTNLPDVCSIREMIVGLQNYFTDPDSCANEDLNMGTYFFHYYILKSALRRRFPVDNFLKQTFRIGNKNDFWGIGSLELFQ
ncbi:MAG: hypothetical protein AB7S48_09000 [Bacteroidales bacterium]